MFDLTGRWAENKGTHGVFYLNPSATLRIAFTAVRVNVTMNSSRTEQPLFKPSLFACSPVLSISIYRIENVFSIKVARISSPSPWGEITPEVKKKRYERGELTCTLWHVQNAHPLAEKRMSDSLNPYFSFYSPHLKPPSIDFFLFFCKINLSRKCKNGTWVSAVKIH